VLAAPARQDPRHSRTGIAHLLGVRGVHPRHVLAVTFIQQGRRRDGPAA